jgi:hypothetical protein
LEHHLLSISVLAWVKSVAQSGPSALQPFQAPKGLSRHERLVIVHKLIASVVQHSEDLFASTGSYLTLLSNNDTNHTCAYSPNACTALGILVAMREVWIGLFSFVFVFFLPFSFVCFE